MTKQDLITKLNEAQDKLVILLNDIPENSNALTEYRLKFEIEAQRISILQIQFDIIKMLDYLSA